MVDDFGNRDLVNIARALLALIVVDENDLGCLGSHGFDQAWCRHRESIKRELRFTAYGPETHRLDVDADFGFQIRIGQSRTN